MRDIYIFNPTGEMAIANSMVSYMPPRKLKKFEDDIAFLPAFYSSDDDIIVTPNKPDNEFIELWQQVGLSNLNFVSSLNELTEDYNYLKPWSWNPVIHHKTKALKEKCSEIFKSSPNFNWKDTNRDFFSRITTNTIQNYIKENLSSDNIEIVTPAILIDSLKEVEKWLSQNNSAILKMPWSSSGRGIHSINPPKGLRINPLWINGAIKQQGFITIEPLLNKVFDFSTQLYLKANGEIDFFGTSFFINDNKGHFIGGSVNWPHYQSEITDFLTNSILNEVAQKLIISLKSLHPQNFYEGPIGIDGIVYKNDIEQLKIHPCVDINWRYNMGMVNISLPKYVKSNSIGTWKVGSFKPGEWNSFIENKQKNQPLIIDDNKIVSGFIHMTPKNTSSNFGVWLEIQ